MSESFYNRVNGDRISSKQVDELIGISRGLLADGVLNRSEIDFLQSWLAANIDISSQPMIRILYNHINKALADGVVDDEELQELMETLTRFTGEKIELGETLKSTSLPLCRPAPIIDFANKKYTFTGTFTFGTRKECETAVIDRGATVGSITKTTNVLVIGSYATESWKHSTYGTKIAAAVEWRDRGQPICIIDENHWQSHLI